MRQAVCPWARGDVQAAGHLMGSGLLWQSRAGPGTEGPLAGAAPAPIAFVEWADGVPALCPAAMGTWAQVLSLSGTGE